MKLSCWDHFHVLIFLAMSEHLNKKILLSVLMITRCNHLQMGRMIQHCYKMQISVSSFNHTEDGKTNSAAGQSSSSSPAQSGAALMSHHTESKLHRNDTTTSDLSQLS